LIVCRTVREEIPRLLLNASGEFWTAMPDSQKWR
jgi:hypothetical protein